MTVHRMTSHMLIPPIHKPVVIKLWFKSFAIFMSYGLISPVPFHVISIEDQKKWHH